VFLPASWLLVSSLFDRRPALQKQAVEKGV
jgi:hypothetical protein